MCVSDLDPDPDTDPDPKNTKILSFAGGWIGGG